MRYTISNFEQAHEVLNTFWPKPGWEYSFERVERFMESIHNPQDNLRVIHVAGTSGKTSTASFAASLLKTTGKKVGLLISPHITELNERIQIDMRPLDETTFCEGLATFLELISESGFELTYFEILYAYGYWEFYRQQVDYAVVEVGLGGLLDATNVVHRADKVCVITDIGFDHMKMLGHTLPEIAAQKAGIIQPHNVVFCHAQAPEIMKVIEGRAQEQQAELWMAEEKPTVPVPFLPLFQRRNFSLALQVVVFVAERDKLQLPDPHVLQRAAAITIPARMEILHVHGKTVILDGAHNGQKMAALRESIQAQFANQPVATLFAFVKSSEERVQLTVAELAKVTQQVIATEYSPTPDSPHHSLPAETVASACREVGLTATPVSDVVDALQDLLARPEPVLLVTGSFYLASYVRPILLAAEEL